MGIFERRIVFHFCLHHGEIVFIGKYAWQLHDDCGVCRVRCGGRQAHQGEAAQASTALPSAA